MADYLINFRTVTSLNYTRFCVFFRGADGRKFLARFYCFGIYLVATAVSIYKHLHTQALPHNKISLSQSSINTKHHILIVTFVIGSMFLATIYFIQGRFLRFF